MEDAGQEGQQAEALRAAGVAARHGSDARHAAAVVGAGAETTQGFLVAAKRRLAYAVGRRSFFTTGASEAGRGAPGGAAGELIAARFCP